MDEELIKRFALQITESRIRVAMLRSLIMRAAKIPEDAMNVIEEESEKTIAQGLASEQFRQIYDQILEHLSGGH